MVEELEPKVRTVLAALGALVGWLTATLPWTVVALPLLMVADVVTGLLAAGLRGEIDSDVGARGAAKKVLVLIYVGCAALAQWAFGQVWPDVPIPALSVVAGIYCGVEFVSITENLGRAGAPVPPVLRQALAKLRPLLGEAEPDADRRP